LPWGESIKIGKSDLPGARDRNQGESNSPPSQEVP
jgi:hypothetical protein